MTPMSSANAKSLSVSPPKKSSAAIGRQVMNVVASERRIVSQIETFAIVANGARRISGMFSLMRSKMMIVSYIEYPSTVSTAATVEVVTSRPVSEYTPTVMSTSCAIADQHGQRELPLEAQGDVDDDQQERHEDGEQSRSRDLRAEARRDALHAQRDVLPVAGLEVVLERRQLRRRQRLRAQLERAVLAVRRGATALDDCARLADLGEDRVEVARRGRLRTSSRR